MINIEIDQLISLDMQFIIYMSHDLKDDEISYIEEKLLYWCQLAYVGEFEGDIHHYTEPEYDQEHKVVIFSCDIGTVNFDLAIKALKDLCVGCNADYFKKETIVKIQVTSFLGDEFI